MAGLGLEVSVLGPVGVRSREGLLRPVGGRREATVLAALALAAPTPVPIEALGDAVWGAAVPRTYRKTLQGFVHRLRRRFGVELIDTSNGGYGLGDGVVVDADRLIELAHLCGQHHKHAQYREAERVARRGLDLVRGPAFVELDEWERSAPERSRIDELILVLEELHLEAQLELGGRDAERVAEAERLVSQAPLREQRWLLLMRAFATADRLAEALNVYERARQSLVEQLGALPGVGIQEEYRRVLELSARPLVELRPSWLPRPVTPFHGRAHELADLSARLGRSRLVAIVGPGGMGKTRLAIEAADRHHARTGRSTCVVDLDQVSTAAELTALVNQTVVGSPAEESLNAVVRALRSQPALLVLDNAEHLANELIPPVHAWLEGAAQLQILVTSQHRLPTPDVDVLTLGPLDDGDAVRLFGDRVTRHNAASGEVDGDVAADICHAVDNLPLAIELAAARTDLVEPADLVRQLTSNEGREQLLASPAGRQGSLRNAIDASYQLLDDGPRNLLHRLAILDADFGVETATGLWVAGAAVTEGALRTLLHRSLIDAVGPDHRRFRLLTVIRHHIRERPEAADARAQAEAALIAWWDDRTQAIAAWTLDNRHAEAIALLDREHGAFQAALRLAGAQNPRLAVEMICRTDDWWRATNRTLAAWRQLTELLGEATLADDPHLRANALGIAVVHGAQSLDVDDAELLDGIDELAALTPFLDDPLDVELRQTALRFGADDPETGRRLEHLLAESRRSAPHWAATVLDFLARWLLMNDAPRALSVAGQCLAAAGEGDNLVSLAHAQEVMAAAHLVNDQPVEAADSLRRATATLALAHHPGCLLHCYETVAWLGAEGGRVADASALLSTVAAMREDGRRRRLPIEWTGYRRATTITGTPGLDDRPDPERRAARLAADILSAESP